MIKMLSKLLPLFLFIMLSFQLKAQKNDSIFFLDPVTWDEFYVDIYNCQFIETPADVDIDMSRNRGVRVSYVKRFSNDYRWYTPGIGIAISNYNIFSNVNRWQNDSSTGPILYPENADYKKNKLALNFVEIPLEFTMRSSIKRNGAFKITFGAKAAWLFDAHTKTKDDDNNISKFKNPRDFERFNYGFYFRMGYAFFHLYAEYIANDVLNYSSDSGIYSVGISLSGF